MCDHDHATYDFQSDYKNRKKFKKCATCGKRAYWEIGAHMPSTGWPYSSDALGVGPDQIQEAGDSLAAAGVPTQFDEEGSLIVENREHRNKVMSHLGMFDRDAGYGDRTPGKLEPEAAMMATGEENAD